MAKPPLWEQYKAQIDALDASQINFDLERRHDYTAANGWNVDAHDADLPPEPPGPPLANGSWHIAQQIIREYRFPDPQLITGIFYPDQPLEQRVMLLRARFLGFTFYFGVRIGGVVDTVRDGPDGPLHVWGYNYHTLQGHFERGQIEFTVIKAERTGAVTFHIESFSQTATIRNPLYRLGFKIFGRPLQRRFARESLRRMQRMVQEQLLLGAPATTPTAPPVQPASADPSAEQRLDALSADLQHAEVEARSADE